MDKIWPMVDFELSSIAPNAMYYGDVFSKRKIKTLLFGRRPDKEIEFACFDSKLQ